MYLKRSAGYRVRKLNPIFKHPDICKVCYVFVSAKARCQMKNVLSSFRKFFNFFLGQFIITIHLKFQIDECQFIAFSIGKFFQNLFNYFLSPCTMDLFIPVNPNESNNRISQFGKMFKILHQCVLLSSFLSSLEIKNEYALFFQISQIYLFYQREKHQESFYSNVHYLSL